MANVFDAGGPDARQSLTDDQKALHDEIKAKAVELEALFDLVKAGGSRYKALAITELESSIMWIVKELTS